MIFAFVLSSLSLSGIPGLSRSNDIIAAALAGYTLIKVSQYGWIVPSWSLAPMLFLLASFVFAIMNSESGLSTYFSILPIWVGAISMALVIQDRKAEDSALTAMILAAAVNLIAVVLGFDSFATYNPLAEFVSETDLLNRASGLVGNANVFAIQGTFAFLALMVLRPEARTSVILVVWVIALHAVMTSGSRKGLGLIFFLSLYIVFVQYFERRITRGRLVAIFATLLTVVVLMNQFETLLNFLPIDNFTALNRVLIALAGQDTSFSERQFLISEATAAFIQRPIFGYGLGAFRHISSKGVYAHSNAVEIAVSGGVVLLMAYYSIYFVVLARLRKRFTGDRAGMRVGLFAISILFIDISAVTYNLEVIPIFLMLVAARSSR
ncbi:MAG: O-antigen ligase family protein [Rhodobacterales bacterium]